MTSSSRKIAPIAALASFVEHVRVVSNVPASLPYQRLPDGQLELIVREASDGPSMNLVGARLTPLTKPSDPITESILLRFKAGGAYPFFGVPVSELTGELVPLSLLLGAAARPVGDALSASTTTARVTAIQAALAARLAQPLFEPGSVPMVRRALRTLASAVDLPRVSELSSSLGVSDRHLRRGFDDVVGVSPKAYLRILRFQRAFRRARQSTTESWARIAMAHGYYDQAHMIAEFRALAGSTPTPLRRAALHSSTSAER